MSISDTSELPCEGVLPALLLVEDSHTIRDMLAAYLRHGSYTVLACKNAEDAMACMKTYSGAVRMLITDIVLEGMTGRELAMSFRRTHPHGPVLFVSGYIETGKFPVFPNSAYLEKPFSLQSLTEAVDKLLNPH